MVHAGYIGTDMVKLILDITDNILDYIERYFHITKQLYFTFTHLVCRSAKPGNKVVDFFA